MTLVCFTSQIESIIAGFNATNVKDKMQVCQRQKQRVNK